MLFADDTLIGKHTREEGEILLWQQDQQHQQFDNDIWWRAEVHKDMSPFKDFCAYVQVIKIGLTFYPYYPYTTFDDINGISILFKWQTMVIRIVQMAKMVYPLYPKDEYALSALFK